MYHRFSGIAGRVVASTRVPTPLAPLSPIKPKNATAVVYDSSVVLSPISLRSASTRYVEGTKIECIPVPQHIKDAQAKFQKDDDVPVHLKGGATDLIIYRITQGLGVVGGVLAVKILLEMAFAP